MLRKLFLVGGLFLSLVSFAQEYEYQYSFFSNSVMAGDFFFSHTASSGGSSIKNIKGKLPVSKSVFHSPGNSLELQYKNRAAGNWKAIIDHHEIRGMDHFKKADFLSFWILNQSEITSADELPAVQLMRKDSTLTSPFYVPAGTLNQWYQVIIPMSSVEKFNANNPENVIAKDTFQFASKRERTTEDVVFSKLFKN